MTNQKTSTLHTILGVAGFTVYLVTYIAGPLVGWEPTFYQSLLLVASYMTLLGFGYIVEAVAEAWGS